MIKIERERTDTERTIRYGEKLEREDERERGRGREKV